MITGLPRPGHFDQQRQIDHFKRCNLEGRDIQSIEKLDRRWNQTGAEKKSKPNDTASSWRRACHGQGVKASAYRSYK